MYKIFCKIIFLTFVSIFPVHYQVALFVIITYPIEHISVSGVLCFLTVEFAIPQAVELTTFASVGGYRGPSSWSIVPRPLDACHLVNYAAISALAAYVSTFQGSFNYMLMELFVSGTVFRFCSGFQFF